MFPLARSLLVLGVALCIPLAVHAQPKADAGSGPTKGAASTNDAGSGPTPGAKPNTGAGDSTGVTTGPNSTGSSQSTSSTSDKKQ